MNPQETSYTLLPTAEGGKTVPPIERDEAYDRDYIPLGLSGWEVQTKGKGSTYRICDPDGDRLAIPDVPYLHETLTRMARAVHASTPTAAIAHLSGEPAGEDVHHPQYEAGFKAGMQFEAKHRFFPEPAAPRAAGQASAVGALVAKWRGEDQAEEVSEADIAYNHAMLTCAAELEAALADAAPDCTEPNRAACPRMCMDFCNAVESGERLADAAPVASSAMEANYELECSGVDRILVKLGLDPERVRSEGGCLNVPRILNHIDETHVALAEASNRAQAFADKYATAAKQLASPAAPVAAEAVPVAWAYRSEDPYDAGQWMLAGPTWEGETRPNRREVIPLYAHPSASMSTERAELKHLMGEVRQKFDDAFSDEAIAKRIAAAKGQVTDTEGK